MEIKKNTLMNFRSPNSYSQNKYERKWKAIIFRVLFHFKRKGVRKIEEKKLKMKRKEGRREKCSFDFLSSLPS